MHLPDPNKRFIIYPDALQKYAMGIILTQEFDGTEQLISTFSCKFIEAQLKYTVGEQKLLATHEACRFFHDIIYGCDILSGVTTRTSPMLKQSTPTFVSYTNDLLLIRNMGKIRTSCRRIEHLSRWTQLLTND